MKINRDNPKYLAYALGELNAQENASVKKELEESEELRQLVEEYRQLGSVIEQELEKEGNIGLSDGQREAIESAIDAPTKGKVEQWPYTRRVILSTAACLVIMFAVITGSTMLLHRPMGPEEGVAIMIDLHMPEPVEELDHIAEAPDALMGDAALLANMDAQTESQCSTAPQKTTAAASPLALEFDAVAMVKSPVLMKGIYGSRSPGSRGGAPDGMRLRRLGGSMAPSSPPSVSDSSDRPKERSGIVGTHDRITENAFESARNKPLSTFSIDVDTASYSMVRQMLNRNRLPSPDSVRIEEMVNYFDYEYVQPQDERPFSVNVDVASCPWAPKHRLVRIGLKGYEIDKADRPPANIVFLLDVSGSMKAQNKLGYVKESMQKLLGQLNRNDTVSIVVYAGASGLVLPATSCEEQEAILAALERLSAGGSTNGGAGIDLAYKTAVANFIKGGINRVILCTDGDFNVGVTGPGGLDRLIEEKAKSGVFLTILGYGMGNFRDNSMERLSNRGNGNYAYIDNLNEANKVLVEQVGSTLVTIAKDVKIQVNFNHQRVNSYRLLGYENRMLAAKDFNDDKKDAGEIGAGHTVTALYEVVPKGVNDVNVPAVDPDKYAVKKAPPVIVAEPSDELLTVKLRYKLPDEDKSTKIEVPVVDSGKHLSSASNDFKFSAAAAGFGMLLRNSEHKGSGSFAMVHELAVEGKGADIHGYRKEFIQLVEKAVAISKPPE